MWDVIGDLVRGGTTVLLTTQYLEEADQLADRIAVIDRGKVIAEGTADELKDQVGGERLELTVADAAHVEDARRALASVGKGEAKTDRDGRRLTVPVAGGSAVLVAAIRELDAAGVVVSDIGLRRPTLDDVFLSLTGHAAEEAAANGDAPDGDADSPTTKEKEVAAR
jgi:ABC-2 type transport system ATP-binding protein